MEPCAKIAQLEEELAKTKNDLADVSKQHESISNELNLLRAENLAQERKIIRLEATLDTIQKLQVFAESRNNPNPIPPPSHKLKSVQPGDIPFSADDERMIQRCRTEYTFDKFCRGKEGLLDFLKSLTRTANGGQTYLCTDRARLLFHRLKDSTTIQWEPDPKGAYLNEVLNMIFKEAYSDFWTELTDKQKNLRGDEREQYVSKELALRPILYGIQAPDTKDREKLMKSLVKEMAEHCFV